MEMEKQVCNLELARKLKELGVKQESYFMWEGIIADVSHMRFSLKKTRDNGNPERCAAFTTAEIGEMLPDYRIPRYFRATKHLMDQKKK